MTGSDAIDYVLPLKWEDDRELADLTAYLRELGQWAHVIVVDGSPDDVFARHARAWQGLATHVRPEPDGYRNGKVTGVHTGLRLATAEQVVIADDDVRYDSESLHRTVALLAQADLVGPQNVFDPMPWHAAWDTARSLLNRAVAADYPGTFAVRRSTFHAIGGYDGDVLFENLELMRTVRAHGGRVLRPRDVYVVRRPPSQDRFVGQRVRQAYDDLAQPWRLATFLPVVPLSLTRRGRRLVLGALAATLPLAEVGRRRGGGNAAFPALPVLLAPAWVLERSVCIWLALAQRVAFGGVSYAGARLGVAASSMRQLRRRALERALVPTRGPETGRPVRPVTEGLAGRATAPAQRDGASARVDPPALFVDDDEASSHDERPVPVRPDHRRGRVLLLGTIVLDHVGRAARAGPRKTASGLQ